jgi:hypothetical protein
MYKVVPVPMHYITKAGYTKLENNSQTMQCYFNNTGQMFNISRNSEQYLCDENSVYHFTLWESMFLFSKYGNKPS